MAEIGSVADAIAEPVDHEAVRAKLVIKWIGSHVTPSIGEKASTLNGRMSGTRSGELEARASTLLA
jgi:hypothetical protein